MELEGRLYYQRYIVSIGMTVYVMRIIFLWKIYSVNLKVVMK